VVFDVHYGQQQQAECASNFAVLQHSNESAVISYAGCNSAPLFTSPSWCNPVFSADAAVQSDTPLPAADVADLLQLAVNCSNSNTAWTAVKRVPDQLQPSSARRLFLTAVVRQHDTSVTLAALQPAVKQHLDASVLCTLVKLSLSADGESGEMNALVRLLVRIAPAARQLGVQDVAALLKAVVQRREVEARAPERDAIAARWRADGMVDILCSLPAAQQLTCDNVMPLLQTLVAACEPTIVHQLCSLPATQQLTAADVMLLLQADAENDDALCVGDFSVLPAAQQLNRDDVMALLHKAVSLGNTEFIYAAHALPAVMQLDNSIVKQLLHDATVVRKELGLEV
jgi:hypothetical protein